MNSRLYAIAAFAIVWASCNKKDESTGRQSAPRTDLSDEIADDPNSGSETDSQPNAGESEGSDAIPGATPPVVGPEASVTVSKDGTVVTLPQDMLLGVKDVELEIEPLKEDFGSDAINGAVVLNSGGTLKVTDKDSGSAPAGDIYRKNYTVTLTVPEDYAGKLEDLAVLAQIPEQEPQVVKESSLRRFEDPDTGRTRISFAGYANATYAMVELKNKDIPAEKLFFRRAHDPEKFQVGTVGASKATVKWFNAGEAAGYVVTYDTDQQTIAQDVNCQHSNRIEAIPGYAQSVQISELAASTNYYVRICAENLGFPTRLRSPGVTSSLQTTANEIPFMHLVYKTGPKLYHLSKAALDSASWGSEPNLLPLEHEPESTVGVRSASMYLNTLTNGGFAPTVVASYSKMPPNPGNFLDVIQLIDGAWKRQHSFSGIHWGSGDGMCELSASIDPSGVVHVVGCDEQLGILRLEAGTGSTSQDPDLGPIGSSTEEFRRLSSSSLVSLPDGRMKYAFVDVDGRAHLQSHDGSAWADETTLIGSAALCNGSDDSYSGVALALDGDNKVHAVTTCSRFPSGASPPVTRVYYSVEPFTTTETAIDDFEAEMAPGVHLSLRNGKAYLCVASSGGIFLAHNRDNSAFASFEISDSPLIRPCFVAVDPDHRWYVAYSGSSQVYYRAENAATGTMGPEQSVAASLSSPFVAGFQIDSGTTRNKSGK